MSIDEKSRWGERGGRIGRARGEDGYVIPMLGLLLIPLMVATAFAVDAGAWYAKGTELQRAVDMAAMAGVVWLPNTTKAQTEATETLQRNGFTSSNASFQFSTPTTTQYRVRATIQTPRIFSGVIQGGDQTLVRVSTAEYNKPVPLGSPENKFGNTLTGDLNGDGDQDPGECINPQSSCAGTQPQLWAAIQGPYTNNADGDPFATRCLGNRSSSSSCGSPGYNPEFREDGYRYAIEAQAGQTVTVQIYDAPLYNTNTANYTKDTLQGNGFDTDYELFTEDGNALTATIDDSLSMSIGGRCSSGPGRRAFPDQYGGVTGSSTLHNRWYTLCTFTAPQTGVYPLRVRTSHFGSDSATGVGGSTSTTRTGGGWNGYSVRATTTSNPQPKIYGIQDMSIWNVGAGSIANFYLAEVGPEHAGKKLVIDMYDPGDGGGNQNFTMQIRNPNNNVFPCTLYYGTTNGLQGNTQGGTEPYPGGCSFYTKIGSNNRFNSRWVRLEIDIPLSYTCSTNCWWTVRYNFGGGTPNDRTVWAVQIVGDPVHLTE